MQISLIANSASATPIVVIAIYLCLLLGLAMFSKTLFRGTSTDYFVASRSIGPFMLLMSVFGLKILNVYAGKMACAGRGFAPIYVIMIGCGMQMRRETALGSQSDSALGYHPCGCGFAALGWTV